MDFSHFYLQVTWNALNAQARSLHPKQLNRWVWDSCLQDECSMCIQFITNIIVWLQRRVWRCSTALWRTFYTFSWTSTNEDSHIGDQVSVETLSFSKQIGAKENQDRYSNIWNHDDSFFGMNAVYSDCIRKEAKHKGDFLLTDWFNDDFKEKQYTLTRKCSPHQDNA